MKKFAVIVERIKDIDIETECKIHERNKYINSYKNLDDAMKMTEAYSRVESDINECERSIRALKLEKMILQNNACIALFDEVMPTVLEVLKRYIGKHYGDKTKQKIYDEDKQKTGCSISISSKYSDSSYNICFADYSVTCSTKCSGHTKKHILIGNKIQAVDFSDLEICYNSGEYIDDISSRIKTILAKYREAFEAKEELKKICREYNGLIVDSMPRLDADKYIYDYMPV